MKHAANLRREALIRELLATSDEPLTISEIYKRIGFKKMSCTMQAVRETVQSMEDTERVPSEKGVRWQLTSRTPSQA
jgi:predicted Zn-ribbon and HTH transcriptional regulator